ncbi:hypothetical protein [Streptosporangium saharense]|uniref:Uncharacterized protein n=1 Tax=Streptosporangium saharense TaxID=1706840 RepID=A0A7W7QWB6_9ACTN|nr:hypothetical protein [Streptosporangium saharense]MBB4920992.1 hypothetical protein [Streptosporangium saharense]
MHDIHQQVVAALAASPAPTTPDTAGLATWLRGLVGPLLLVVISIVAGFFLFTREITRFVQFLLLAAAILVIFYFPDVLVGLANGIATALGLKTGSGG